MMNLTCRACPEKETGTKSAMRHGLGYPGAYLHMTPHQRMCAVLFLSLFHRLHKVWLAMWLLIHRQMPIAIARLVVVELPA